MSDAERDKFEVAKDALTVVLIASMILLATVSAYKIHTASFGGGQKRKSKEQPEGGGGQGGPLSQPTVGIMVVDETVQGFDQANKVEKNLLDNRVKAVVVKINSPGGSVQGCYQLEYVLSRVGEKKPVVALLQEKATSGAYLVASVADEIVARKYTLTAGLGVLSVWTSYENQYEREGIEHFVFKSSRHKDVYAPWRGPTENEKKRIKKKVERLSEGFFSRIENNRPTADLSGVRDGTVIYGEEALKRNMVDNLGTYEDAVDIATEMAGFDNDYGTRKYDIEKKGIVITVG